MSNKKRRKAKRGKIAVSLLTLVIVLAFIYCLMIFNVLIPEIKPTDIKYVDLPSTHLEVQWPKNSESAIGVQGYGVIDSSPNQTKSATASIAKLITALAVLKVKPLGLGQGGPIITITANDVDIYNQYIAEEGSVAKVTIGEQISEYQVLQAMLLPSANNMADTLAIWAFGSIASYTNYANNLASSLGLSDTHIADASGFSPETVSTPDNLVILGQDILDNPVLTQIIGQSHAEIPVAGTIDNVNWLLGSNNIIGVKTGNTDSAGGCYLFAAKYNLSSTQNITVIGAIQKAPTLQLALDQSVPILNSIKTQLDLRTYVQKGTVVASYKPIWGGVDNVVTKQTINLATLAGMRARSNMTINKLKDTATAGISVGELNVTTGGQTQTTSLILEHSINKPSWFWKLTHPDRLL